MIALDTVVSALHAAGIATTPAPSDWIDDAVWAGPTTLVGVHDDLITVLTRPGDVPDVWRGTYDAPDAAFIAAVRESRRIVGRYTRAQDAVAQREIDRAADEDRPPVTDNVTMLALAKIHGRLAEVRAWFRSTVGGES